MDFLIEDLLDEPAATAVDKRFAGVAENGAQTVVTGGPERGQLEIGEVSSNDADTPLLPAVATLLPAPELAAAPEFPPGWTSEDLELVFDTPAATAPRLSPLPTVDTSPDALAGALILCILSVALLAWWLLSPPSTTSATERRLQEALALGRAAAKAAKEIEQGDPSTLLAREAAVLRQLGEAELQLDLQARAPVGAARASQVLHEVWAARGALEDILRPPPSPSLAPGPAPGDATPLLVCPTGEDPPTASTAADQRLLARVASGLSVDNPLAIVGLMGQSPASPSLADASAQAGLPRAFTPDEVCEVHDEGGLRRRTPTAGAMLPSTPPRPLASTLALSSSGGMVSASLRADLSALAAFGEAGGMGAGRVHEVVTGALANLLVSHHTNQQSLAHMTALHAAGAEDAQRRHLETLGATRTLGEAQASASARLEETMRETAEEQVALQVSSVVADHHTQAVQLSAARVSFALSLSWLCLAVAVGGGGFMHAAVGWLGPCSCHLALAAPSTTSLMGRLGSALGPSLCGYYTAYIQASCLVTGLVGMVTLGAASVALAPWVPRSLMQGAAYATITGVLLLPMKRVVVQHWGIMALVGLTPLASMATLFTLFPYTVPSGKTVHSLLVQRAESDERTLALAPDLARRRVQSRAWAARWALTILHILIATVGAAVLHCAARLLDAPGGDSGLSDGWLPVGAAQCAANTLMHLLHEGIRFISA